MSVEIIEGVDSTTSLLHGLAIQAKAAGDIEWCHELHRAAGERILHQIGSGGSNGRLRLMAATQFYLAHDYDRALDIIREITPSHLGDREKAIAYKLEADVSRDREAEKQLGGQS